MQNHALESSAQLNKSVMRYLSLDLYFFGLEILMPGIFLGLKFQACVFFLGLQYEAPSDPPSCILRIPPWGVVALLLDEFF